MKDVKKMFINPFDYINPEKIRDKVNKLKDRHPDWEKEDLARELVKQKSRICAGAGALSALPSSIPGLGPVITVIGGTAVDITTTVYFLSELTLEIASVYNRNPGSESTIREALWVLSSCFGVEAATVGVSKVTVISASKKALVVLIEKLFTIIGGWLAKRILLKMIPIVGSILNASINMAACKHVGKETVLWYKANPEQDSLWQEASKKEDNDDFLDEEEIKPNDIPDENIVFETMNKEDEDEIDEYIEDEIDEYIEDIYIQESEIVEIKEETEEKKTDTNEIKKGKEKEKTEEEKTDTNEIKKGKEEEKIEEKEVKEITESDKEPEEVKKENPPVQEVKKEKKKK
jgi:hypothetical protein